MHEFGIVELLSEYSFVVGCLVITICYFVARKVTKRPLHEIAHIPSADSPFIGGYYDESTLTEFEKFTQYAVHYTPDKFIEVDKWMNVPVADMPWRKLQSGKILVYCPNEQKLYDALKHQSWVETWKEVRDRVLIILDNDTSETRQAFKTFCVSCEIPFCEDPTSHAENEIEILAPLRQIKECLRQTTTKSALFIESI